MVALPHWCLIQLGVADGVGQGLRPGRISIDLAIIKIHDPDHLNNVVWLI